MMVREAFDWLMPAPLWDNGLQAVRRPDFFQPQLVQFTDENFMKTLRAAAMSNDTSQLQKLVISPPASTSPPLKLFQAAHGCHYLVCAELTCRMPGFPDRTVQRSDGESVFFVMRRFIDAKEYGWVVNGSAKSWQSVNEQPRVVLPNEERLPLFPIAASGQRSIFAGYIPVATGDVYSLSIQDLNAAAGPGEQPPFPIDYRIEQLEALFTTPLNKNFAEVKRQPAMISVYMLLDLLDFFINYLPSVATALGDPTSMANNVLSSAEQQLMAFLAGQTVGGGPALDAALRAVAQQRNALTAAGGADPTQLGFGNYDLTAGSIDTTGLESAVQNALPSSDPSQVYFPRLNAVGETYALRCVYERPQCSPPLQVVSQVSQSFQLASFFDGDAPARSINIIMPTDVSLAGIRKFRKGVTFIISNSLQQKINMITGSERSMLQPSPTVGSAANGLAWMCSFSIQIVFIVAFMLLLMFVIILNICFWWIAFFRICIPIPKKLLSG